MYQPWARYSGQPVVPMPGSDRRPRGDNKTGGNNWEKMGTEQMDIRYRTDNTKPAQPAFVPLQVSRKAVKTKERSEEKKSEIEENFQPQVEEVPAFVIKKKETASRAGSEGKAKSEDRESKERTPQRNTSRGETGEAKENSNRKKRIAANFGEDN